MESLTAVDRVLAEAHNLIDSGHDRVNIGGIWICWECGLPERQHTPQCFIGSLTTAVKAYRETPRFILGLSPDAKTRQDYEALHKNGPRYITPPLSDEDLAGIRAEVARVGDVDPSVLDLLLDEIGWLQVELDRIRGDLDFRTAVKDLLEKMRSTGGDGTGLAMYLYRKGGNRRPDGSKDWGDKVESVVVALETVWGFLGGDPRRSS